MNERKFAATSVLSPSVFGRTEASTMLKGIVSVRSIVHIVAMGAILGYLTLDATAQTKVQQIYSLEHMLAAEQMGRIKIDPMGRRLVFERIPSFNDQVQFHGGGRSDNLYAIGLNGAGEVKPLFAPRSSYYLGNFSPDGTRVAFFQGTDESFAAGVYDFATERAMVFKPTATMTYAFGPEDPSWISNTQFVYATMGGNRLPFLHDNDLQQRNSITSAWQRQREGKMPTSSFVGSGRYINTESRHTVGTLALADVESGEVKAIASGNFVTWTLSPDRKRIAAVRITPRRLDANVRMVTFGTGYDAWLKELIVYNFDTERIERTDCDTCDLLPKSLNWSPDGRKLAFLSGEGDWSKPVYRVYDSVSETMHQVPLGELELHLGRTPSIAHGAPSPKSAWLGEQFVVYAKRRQAIEKVGSARPDWFLIRPDAAPVNLTADFNEPAEVIGSNSSTLLMQVEGNIWRVDGNGVRLNLTEKIEEPVVAWREPRSMNFVGPGASQAGSFSQTITLQTKGEDDVTRLGVYLLQPDSGRIVRVQTPLGSSTIAASSAHQIAYLQRTQDSVTELSVGAGGGAVRPLLKLNEHLAGVARGSLVLLDHEGPSGVKLKSGLMFPPGYNKGTPLPMVVELYINNGGPKWRGIDPDRGHTLTKHLLASHGYAVLFPDVPVETREVPREPLADLADWVLSAVDAAVSAGYADPDRLGVQGQSYGGYMTMGVIGQTNRFKAAVALDSSYNLISLYGNVMTDRRLDMEFDGPDMVFPAWSESGQGGMGQPPWRDPQRYLRNSPIMYTDSISTPVLLIGADRSYVSITHSEEMFVALHRSGKDAGLVRYWGDRHVLQSPANIRDMWSRIFNWYDELIGPPVSPHIPIETQPMQ